MARARPRQPTARLAGLLVSLLILLVALIARQVGHVGSPPRPGTSQPAENAPAADAVPVTAVVDGDTIRVHWRGLDEPVRLLRINTPERDEPGYSEAKEALRALVAQRQVRLEFEHPAKPERDKYGRLLAYVLLDGRCVNVEMVRSGWSRFETRYGGRLYTIEFERAEAEAKAAKRGLWKRP